MRDGLATPELRAFEVFDRVPAGCVLHLARDDQHAPHVRAGEFVVVDPTDTDLISGEMYQIRWNSSGRLDVMQVVRSDRQGVDGVYFVPLNGPKSQGDCRDRLRRGQRIYFGDGPLKPDCLSDYLCGRVIGIYQGPEVAAPSVRRLANG